MARQVITTLVDDLDGESEAEGTVRFALDGVDYEIDLSADNSAALHNTLSPYAEVARKVGRTSKGKTVVMKKTHLPASPATIRAWAESNDVECSERGRIPRAVVEKYEQAQAGKEAPRPAFSG